MEGAERSWGGSVLVGQSRYPPERIDIAPPRSVAKRSWGAVYWWGVCKQTLIRCSCDDPMHIPHKPDIITCRVWRRAAMAITLEKQQRWTLSIQ